MAEKRVSELTEATTVSDADLFVMEQGGVAKKAAAAILKTAFGSTTEEVLIDHIDMSAWDSCSFTVTKGEETLPGSVEFDSNNRPTSVTLNGHTLTLTLPEVE